MKKRLFARKTMAAVMTAMMAAGLLAGCGSKQAAPAETTQAPVETTAAAETAAAED